MRLVWDFVVGPVLAMLPTRWRKRLVVAREVQWVRAGTASGMYELIGAVVALGYWYMYEMGKLVGAGTEEAASGRLGGGVTEHQIAGTALTIFALHPVTWLLFYLFFEGVVRTCSAAFAENTVGTLPLWIVERVLYSMGHSGEVSGGIKENAGSFAGAIRERARQARGGELTDEVTRRKDGSDEIVEIRAWKRKDEWVPPKVVRMGEAFYRLEESWTGNGERPFCYRLRKLAAGVMGRTVLLYEEPVEK